MPWGFILPDGGVGLVHLERAGQYIWKRIQPLSKQWLPIKNARGALLLGMLWGWLPCGLVYSNLIWATSQGNSVQGAALMASFGLGTLPAVFLTGAFAQPTAWFYSGKADTEYCRHHDYSFWPLGHTWHASTLG